MKASTNSRPAGNKQSLSTVQNPATTKVTTYSDMAGNKVELSIQTIKSYLCPGSNISDSEAFMFLSLCQFQKLNPWTREAYCVKYGSSPATMIVGKETYTKRAAAHPKFKGMKAGVVVLKEDGSIENRVGELVLPGEELVGGWADVYVKDYVEPVSAVVSLRERQQMKDGKPASKWATSPGLMIRKCALVAALREAFPDALGGMYIAEEVTADRTEDDINLAPVAPPKYQDVAYTDVETGEVVEPDGEEDMTNLFGEEG